MVFKDENEREKQIIASCSCGCDDYISLKHYKEDTDYSVSIGTSYFYSKQNGIFRTIIERLKMCWMILRGKSYLLCDIILSEKEMKEFVDDLIEFTNTDTKIDKE